jgi:hypothetical protein
MRGGALGSVVFASVVFVDKPGMRGIGRVRGPFSRKCARCPLKNGSGSRDQLGVSTPYPHAVILC